MKGAQMTGPASGLCREDPGSNKQSGTQHMTSSDVYADRQANFLLGAGRDEVVMSKRWEGGGG